MTLQETVNTQAQAIAELVSLVRTLVTRGDQALLERISSLEAALANKEAETTNAISSINTSTNEVLQLISEVRPLVS